MPEVLESHTLFGRAVRAWWLVVLLMMIGGGLGYLLHLAQPPVYEGRASIAFAFDLARTGKMSASEEDMAMGAAGVILFMPPVLEQVAAEAEAKNIRLEDYPQWHKISLERKNYLWVLRLRFSNPQDAAVLANLWIEKAYAQLVDAGAHAEKAEGLRRTMEGLEGCLQNMAVVEPSSAQCAWPSQAELQSELLSLGERHLQEKQAARGLIPALTFSLAEKAEVDNRPVLYQRGAVILAGALIGLLLAVLLIASGLVERVSDRIRSGHPPAGAR